MAQSADPFSRELELYLYKEGRELGRGAQGAVYIYKPLHPSTSTFFAVKVVEYDFENIDEEGRPTNATKIKRESNVSSRLQHEHLLHAHDVFEFEEGCAIIMPYFPSGNLYRLSLNFSELRVAVCQILQALYYLHHRNIIHRDIKPGNILVRSAKGEPLDLVVADYGGISLDNPVSLVGTPRFIAPEILRNRCLELSERRQYTKKVDIYALGMLILDILKFRPVTSVTGERKVYEKHVAIPLQEEINNSGVNSERHAALLVAQTMVAFNPRDRPSAQQCLQNPWLIQVSAKLPCDPNLPVKTESTGCLVPQSAPDWSRYNFRDRKRPRDHSEDNIDSEKSKSQKLSHGELLTPRPTPEKKAVGNQISRVKTEDDISFKFNTLMSKIWDKYPLKSDSPGIVDDAKDILNE